MSEPVPSSSADNPLNQSAAVATEPRPGQERSASLWGDAWRELIRNPVFVISSLFLLVVGSMALFPWLWTSKSHRDCNVSIAHLKPSSEHWFGTSILGCDSYTEAVYGAQPSLLIALMATAGITLIGVPVGTLAGFYGKWTDAIISRVLDIIFSLPFLLGAIVFLTVIRINQEWVIALILTLLGWPGIARLMRGNVIQAKNLDYVQAAKALGATNGRLMFRHIMPNAIAPVVVVATIALGGFVAAEATLTFLGVGLKPPDKISWGMMIAQHDDWFDSYPWLVLFPCGLLVGTVLSFILMGDALRDALDPKLR